MKEYKKQLAELNNQEVPVIETRMGNKTLSVANVGGYTQNILGKVLTVIDAVVPNTKQAKAIKDVIKNDVWSSYRTLQNYIFDGDDEIGLEFPFEFLSDEDFEHFPDTV